MSDIPTEWGEWWNRAIQGGYSAYRNENHGVSARQDLLGSPSREAVHGSVCSSQTIPTSQRGEQWIGLDDITLPVSNSTTTTSNTSSHLPDMQYAGRSAAAEVSQEDSQWQSSNSRDLWTGVRNGRMHGTASVSPQTSLLDSWLSMPRVEPWLQGTFAKTASSPARNTSSISPRGDSTRSNIGDLWSGIPVAQFDPWLSGLRYPLNASQSAQTLSSGARNSVTSSPHGSYSSAGLGDPWLALSNHRSGHWLDGLRLPISAASSSSGVTSGRNTASLNQMTDLWADGFRVPMSSSHRLHALSENHSQMLSQSSSIGREDETIHLVKTEGSGALFY